MTTSDPEEPSPAAVERLRREVAQAERRLSQAHEELEIVTSILNHDMRSPLVSVMGFVAELGYLRDESFALWGKADSASSRRPALEQDFEEAFRYIENGAKKMGRLLDVLSALASHRRRVLVVAAVELGALVNTAAETIADLPAGALQVQAALPTLETDKAALLELFRHILDNAVRYRRAEMAPAVSVTHETSEDRVVVRLQDNGRGIAAADRARAFRPFVRLAPLAEPREGVGLTHARSIARRLGGELSLESSDAPGTIVRLELPRAAPSSFPTLGA